MSQGDLNQKPFPHGDRLVPSNGREFLLLTRLVARLAEHCEVPQDGRRQVVGLAAATPGQPVAGNRRLTWFPSGSRTIA